MRGGRAGSCGGGNVARRIQDPLAAPILTRRVKTLGENPPPAVGSLQNGHPPSRSPLVTRTPTQNHPKTRAEAAVWGHGEPRRERSAPYLTRSARSWRTLGVGGWGGILNLIDLSAHRKCEQ